jgi:mRNA-degrading endonuclease RelE of RelBE toxin-antitoxin system
MRISETSGAFISWNYQYKPAFLKDLKRVQPARIRTRIENIVFNDMPTLQSPFDHPALEAMQGHHGFYKIRVGSFRIGLCIHPPNHTVIFYRVLHRRDIYRYFP